MLGAQTMFVINRVANGWVVEFPRAPEPASIRPADAAYLTAISNMTDKLIKKRDQDPLLASLMGEDETPEPKGPVIAKPRPSGVYLEQEANVFIFATFQDVLVFLNHQIDDR